jgi:hypothetical protein
MASASRFFAGASVEEVSPGVRTSYLKPMDSTEEQHREAIGRIEAEAARRQALYAASRRAWAEEVGRPYDDDEPDHRPPPGELDAEADEG